jgi:hypothetical protein
MVPIQHSPYLDLSTPQQDEAFLCFPFDQHLDPLTRGSEGSFHQQQSDRACGQKKGKT